MDPRRAAAPAEATATPPRPRRPAPRGPAVARAGAAVGAVACAAALLLAGRALPEAGGRGAAAAQAPPTVEQLAARAPADLEERVNAYLLGVPADCLVGVEYEIETAWPGSVGDHHAMVVRRC